MKNIFILAIFIILFTPFLSATIVINTQNLEDTYNLEDVISIPIEISASEYMSDTLSINLFCNGAEIEVWKQDVVLNTGEDIITTAQIRLNKKRLQRSTATCIIKLTSENEEPILSKKFEISDKIDITTKIEKSEFSPGEIIIIEGDAIKENGKSVQGEVEISASIINSSENMQISSIVKNGYFYAEIPLTENTKAGEYTISINVYEKDSQNEITNKGFISEKLTVIQIPTSLEIIFDEEEIEPGTSVKAKTILHDQTGERIESLSIITIKNEKNEILEQSEKPTNEYLEYKIAYNEPPKEWIVVAISNKLNAETTFKIKERKQVDIKLLNSTLRITNTGNVLYNDSVLVKIGEESLELNVILGIDETQEFTLTAPKGEYEVSIMTNGENRLTQSGVILTGRSIDVRAASEGVIKIINHPIAWLFMAAIFGFIVFMFFKKGYQKSIFGYIKSKKKHENQLQEHKKKFNSLLNFGKTKDKTLTENISNKAEMSLSIKGTKQDASVVCLKIKNFKNIDVSKIKDTLQKITNSTKENKGMIYDNQENIFFLFAPVKTKTFKNERTAIELAQKIKKVLTEHNKIFKQRIEFGISVNYGSIIAKPEKDVLKFMSLGALMNIAKKIANISEEEILLDEKIKTKLATSVKVEKQEINGLAVYSIKEIKKLGDNKKFLEGFVQRMKDEKK